VLWGRSLGASTILLYDRKPTPLPVEVLVLDTVFTDVKEIVKSIATRLGLPDEIF
jgi:hypothetical protein